ncbi:unnamed protein product [Symbiodinium sp. CCMP2592]|nr:unnamed protein product [Symbiodinium sp. CCMP2592]
MEEKEEPNEEQPKESSGYFAWLGATGSPAPEKPEKSGEQVKAERYATQMLALDRVISNWQARSIDKKDALVHCDHILENIKAIGSLDGDIARTFLNERGISDSRCSDLCQSGFRAEAGVVYMEAEQDGLSRAEADLWAQGHAAEVTDTAVPICVSIPQIRGSRWSSTAHAQEYIFPGAPVLVDPVHCMGDDLYRDYFEEVRVRMEDKTAEQTMQDGILGTRVELLIANQAFLEREALWKTETMLELNAWAEHGTRADGQLRGSCSPRQHLSVQIAHDCAKLLHPDMSERMPAVNLCEGRIVVTQRICQTLLQNPLSPEAQDKQERLIADVAEVMPSFTANQVLGYFTGLPQYVVSDLLSGACGKMLQARSRADREADEFREVLEPMYRWPQASIASQPLEAHGLRCKEAEPVQVGEHGDVTSYDELPVFFADLDHPMPADGRITDIKVNAMLHADEGLRLDVILLRPQRVDGQWRFERRGELVLLGEGADQQDLLVWRGDILAFAGIGLRIFYRPPGGTKPGLSSHEEHRRDKARVSNI